MDLKEKEPIYSESEYGTPKIKSETKENLKRIYSEEDDSNKALYGIFADPDELSNDEEWLDDINVDSLSEDENNEENISVESNEENILENESTEEGVSQDEKQSKFINLDPLNLEESDTRILTWVDDPSVFKEFFFTGNERPVSIANQNDPIEYFNLFFTEQFYKLVVDQTNLYANQMLKKSGSKCSRIQAWKYVDINEFKVFLGLLFHMGNIQLPGIDHYWKINYLYNIPVFCNHMSRNRFQLLLRVLHFNENPMNSETPTDRLHKIQPLMELFNNIMEEVYYPEKNLCIDSLVLWRDRLLFRQYVPRDQYKYGIRLYLLREPDGMILKLVVCTVSKDRLTDDRKHAARIVHELMAEKLYQGHSLYMDDFYTNIELSHELLSKQVHVTGILREGSENVPKEITRRKLKKNELVTLYSEDGVSVQRWKGNREILMLSTEHQGEIVEIQGRHGKKETLKSLLAYKQFMKRVDMVDQMFLYHPCGGKALRWNQKLGIHMFQLLLLNSFFLYKKNTNNMSWLQYRDTIIDYLLKYKEKIPSTSAQKRRKETLSHTPKRESEIALFHTPKIVKRENETRAKRRKCINCFKNKKRRDTVYSCTECLNTPALCLDCFPIFHQLKSM